MNQESEKCNEKATIPRKLARGALPKLTVTVGTYRIMPDHKP